MAIRALDLMAKVSSRFLHEILPVVTASVIGALLVNHYGRQPAPPSIVVQAQPSASEDAMLQSVREQHELIASFVKHEQQQEMDINRSESGATQAASAAPTPLPVLDPPLPQPRPAAAQSVARSAPKAPPRRKPALAEAPAPQPDPSAVGSESPPLPDSLPPPTEMEPALSARPIIRVAGAVGEWVTDVAQAPVRVAFRPRLPDWPSMPPLVRRLGFFWQN